MFCPGVGGETSGRQTGAGRARGGRRERGRGAERGSMRGKGDGKQREVEEQLLVLRQRWDSTRAPNMFWECLSVAVGTNTGKAREPDAPLSSENVVALVRLSTTCADFYARTQHLFDPRPLTCFVYSMMQLCSEGMSTPSGAPCLHRIPDLAACIPTTQLMKHIGVASRRSSGMKKDIGRVVQQHGNIMARIEWEDVLRNDELAVRLFEMLPLTGGA